MISQTICACNATQCAPDPCSQQLTVDPTVEQLQTEGGGAEEGKVQKVFYGIK